MKQIFTLLAAVFAALNSFAQISENFNGGLTALSSSCWKVTSGATIVNKGSNSTPNNWLQMPSTGSYDISTPYFDFNGTFTVSFDYQIDNSLNNNATRTIQIGTTDKNGVFTLRSTAINADNPPNKSNAVSRVITLNNLTARFTIRVIGQQGDGQCNVLLDNITVTGATFHYATTDNPKLSCNTAPKANDDIFYPAPRMAYSNNVIVNDIETNTGEKIVRAEVVTQPAIGSVTLNADGTFAYTPPTTGFNGGLVTFEYRVYDNGYDQAQSNIATVYLEYPENSSTLPVKLVNFAGRTVNEKTQLSWTVADNENARYFEVQRSINGTDFANTGIVFAANHSGPASYSFADAVKPEQKQYYRLKLWDKDGAFEYSNVILLQTNVTTTQPLKVWQPSASVLGLQFNTTKAEKLQLAVVSLSGTVLHQQTVSSPGGVNAQNISLRQPLKPGVYLVQLRNETSVYSTKLLVP